MYKFLFPVLILLVSCTRVGPPEFTERSTGVVQRNRDEMSMLLSRTVSIHQVCKDNASPIVSTGFVVKHEKGASTVVTAAHTVRGILAANCEVWVKDSHGTYGKGVLLKMSRGTDVATLYVRRQLGAVSKLFNDPFLGQRVTCVGWPNIPYKSYVGRSITKGHVSTLNVGPYIRISAHLYYGNSGGACFSADGRVVGVVSHFIAIGRVMGAVVTQPGMYYISHVDNVRDLLD
ncbi:MAG: serine protease [Sulfurovum sp.]|nr:serine protease [Sulfurovum sp.]